MASSETRRLSARSGRLTRSHDFDRAYRHGRSYGTRYVVMHVFARENTGDPDVDSTRDEVRLGVSVNKKVGGAVERSRVKRLMREAFSSVSSKVPGGYDVVLVGRPALLEVAQGGLAGVLGAVNEVVEKMLRAES